MSFSGTSAAPANVAIPRTAPPNAIVAPYWDDLNPGIGGSISSYNFV